MSELAKAARRGWTILSGLLRNVFVARRVRSNSDKHHRTKIVLSTSNFLMGTYGFGILFLKVRMIKRAILPQMPPSDFLTLSPICHGLSINRSSK